MTAIAIDVLNAAKSDFCGSDAVGAYRVIFGFSINHFVSCDRSVGRSMPKLERHANIRTEYRSDDSIGSREIEDLGRLRLQGACGVGNSDAAKINFELRNAS